MKAGRAPTPAGILTVIAASFLLAAAVQAQDLSGITGPPTLQFSFSNPGARAMGFGGAFVALADDATAAFANPAGLVQIAEPEVSLEGRYWSYSTPFTERGRVSGEPTGIGVDTVAGLEIGTSSYDSTGLSFFSLVYPRDRWSFAFYRHQLADFGSVTATRGLFVAGNDPLCCRFVEQRVRTDLGIVGYGLSAAYRLTDALSIGLSVVYFDGDVKVAGEIFLPDEDETLQIFAPTSYLPERQVVTTVVGVDDSDRGLTGGFLWLLSPRWRVGGFVREGPTFELTGEGRSGPAGGLFGLPPAGTLLDTGSSPIAFPDVYGLGCAFRSQDGRLTIGLEWDRVGYSAILDRLDRDDFDDIEQLDLEDGNELRLGGEYVFLGSTPLAAVRLGLWHDPDHQPRANAAGSDFEQALLRPGDDELHFAVGLGLAFETFQIDLAADFSELVDSVSVSAIYSF